jgi:phosphate/sulfate permease
MVVIGIMYGIMAFGTQSFLIPTWHIFMLIALGLIMVPLMYRIYLAKNNLEPAFISRMPKERKVNFYRVVIYCINLGVLICIVMFNFTHGYQTICNAMALFMLFYISDIIHINAPNKKIVNEAGLNYMNLILLIISLVASLYFLSNDIHSLFMN